MRIVDLSVEHVTIGELLEMAGQDDVILKAPAGRKYLLAEIDDGAEEVEMLRRNPQLRALLTERPHEAGSVEVGEASGRHALP